MKIQVYLASEKDIIENIAHILEKPYKTIETKDINGLFVYEINIEIESKYKADLENIIARSLKIYNEF